MIERKTSRRSDQGIEDSVPVEILFGKGRAGSASYYLYQEIMADGYHMRKETGQNGIIEFYVNPDDVPNEVLLVAQETQKRPGYKVLSRALAGFSSTPDQIEEAIGEATIETVVGFDLVAAAKCYDDTREAGSVRGIYQAWREYLSRKVSAKRVGVYYVDALNHIIELVREEYQKAKSDLGISSS